MADPNPFTEEADLFADTNAPTQTIAPPAPAAPPTPASVRPVWQGPSAFDAGIQQARVAARDLPYQEADQAVGQAIKFQATRGYQRDLQNGMAPSEALAKWAPMMFGSSSMSGMAGVVRAAAPPRPINAQGTLYNYNEKTRSVTPTPGQVQRVIRPPVNPLDADQFKDNLKKIDEAVADGDYRRANQLRWQNEGIRAKYLTPAEKAAAAAPRTSPPRTTTSTGRVRVRRPDGKIGSIPANQVDAAVAAGYSRMP